MHLLIFEDLIEELRAAATEIAKSRDEMKAMAVTDPLTRCYNRRLLYEIAEHELEQHRRYNLPLSILYLDIDHFKAINDTRGHHTGDEVLKTMGAILRELTRQADFVFRWGGDEFVVLLSASEPEAQEQGEQDPARLPRVRDRQQPARRRRRQHRLRAGAAGDEGFRSADRSGGSRDVSKEASPGFLSSRCTGPGSRSTDTTNISRAGGASALRQPSTSPPPRPDPHRA